MNKTIFGLLLLIGSSAASTVCGEPTVLASMKPQSVLLAPLNNHGQPSKDLKVNFQMTDLSLLDVKELPNHDPNKTLELHYLKKNALATLIFFQGKFRSNTLVNNIDFILGIDFDLCSNQSFIEAVESQAKKEETLYFRVRGFLQQTTQVDIPFSIHKSEFGKKLPIVSTHFSVWPIRLSCLGAMGIFVLCIYYLKLRK